MPICLIKLTFKKEINYNGLVMRLNLFINKNKPNSYSFILKSYMP